jgi:hypothetical protein
MGSSNSSEANVRFRLGEYGRLNSLRKNSLKESVPSAAKAALM